MSLTTLIQTHKLSLNKCRPDDFLDEAVDVLTKSNVNALAVFEGENKLVGILTDSDIIRAAHANQQTAGTLGSEHVFNWMTNNVVTCPFETSLGQALNIMAKNKIRHLVAHDEATKKTVVISIRDVLTSLHEEDVLEKNILRDLAHGAAVNDVS